MKKTTILLLAATVSTPAFAQEAPAFSGFRAEALAGYDRVDLKVDEQVDSEGGEGHQDGFLYGIGVGYDFAVSGVTLGVDAEYADATTKQRATIDNVEVEGYLLDGTASVRAARDLYVGGRVGAVATPSTLIYAKAGWSFAEVDVSATGSIDGEAGSIAGELDVDGLRLGLGVEQLIGRNAFMKLEYRYTNYSGAEVSSSDGSLNVDDAFDYGNLERHQALVGLGYRF